MRSRWGEGKIRAHPSSCLSLSSNFSRRCISWGSNPAASLHWQMAGQPPFTASTSLTDVVVKVNETSDWNTTRSWALYRYPSLAFYTICI
jgi:hypothetical protein